MGEKKEANREVGSVPIFPATEPDKLIAYVRSLAAILRQGEHIPADAEFNPTHELGKQMLPNFEARILPRDLRSENITVNEATNEFSLFLDFDKQYNALNGDSLYVASKLYSQTIYYDWKIYQVPPIPEISPAGPSDEEWVMKWPALYEHYNPRSGVLDGEIRATTGAGTVAIPPSGFETGDDDLTTRVLSPKRLATISSCQTRHKPIGDANLRRVSSVAYYPVRTRTREALATPRITKVTSGLASVEEELLDIRGQLAEDDKTPGTLTAIERKVLEQTLKDLTVQKGLFEKREHGGMVSSIDAQIADGNAKLKVAERLKKRLPEILAQAKANAESGTGSSKPTELLADDPELLTLYLRLKIEGKHAAGYVNELINDIADLRKTRERVSKFDEDFSDAPTGACTYTPEVVFVSKVNGLIYPMMMMVRESRPKTSYEKIGRLRASLQAGPEGRATREGCGSARARPPRGARAAARHISSRVGSSSASRSRGRSCSRRRCSCSTSPSARSTPSCAASSRSSSSRSSVRSGSTFLYVTHDQEEALTMSDRLAVMSNGKVEQLGAPRDVYEHPETSFVADFLGVSNLMRGRVVEGEVSTSEESRSARPRARLVEVSSGSRFARSASGSSRLPPRARTASPPRSSGSSTSARRPRSSWRCPAATGCRRSSRTLATSRSTTSARS